MSFLRNLVRRSAGLAADAPLRPPRGLPVFGPSATEAAPTESLEAERGAPAAEPPATVVRETRIGTPEPAGPAEPATPSEPAAGRPAEPVIPVAHRVESIPATRIEPAAPAAPAVVREDRLEVVVSVPAEAVARADRVPEPPARAKARAPQIVSPEVDEGPRPEPVTARPVAVEVPVRAAPPAEPDPAVSTPPAVPRLADAREVSPVPQAQELPRRADPPRPATLEAPRDPPAARPALQPRPAERPWIATPPAAPASEPPVEIRIGRVEVRAPRAPDPAPVRAPTEPGFPDLVLARRGLERRWY